MRALALGAVLLVCAGCRGVGPYRVFLDTTQAFARGDAAGAARGFSRRLSAARPLPALRSFYSVPENRRGVAYLLEGHRFSLLEEGAVHAVGRVTWSTGRSEPVYFVREGGEWKLDLEPAPEGAPGAPARRGSRGTAQGRAAQH